MPSVPSRTARSGKVVTSLPLGGPSRRFPHEAVENFAADLAETASLIAARGFGHPLGQVR